MKNEDSTTRRTGGVGDHHMARHRQQDSAGGVVMSAPQIGVLLPPFGTNGVGSVQPYARHAEECGLESVWAGDQLIATRPVLDSTLVLATAAAVTSRIKIGFGVLILALRPTAWAAKQVATLQHLSGNRALLGVGVGGEMHGDASWRAAGVPFAERGKRTDAALQLLPSLVAGELTSIEGEPVRLAPPAAMPPVLIGGGQSGLRRAARFGYDWYPSMAALQEIAAGARHLASLSAERGQQAPGITVDASAGLGQVPASAIDEQVRGLIHYGLDENEARQVPITGSPANAVERFAELAEAGAGRIVVSLFGGDWFRQCEQLGEVARLLR